MSYRTIAQIVRGQEVSEGAGVRLRRLIGTRELDHVDPFLLLDEFKSEDGADYGLLLRCTGFAYAWFALLVGYSLPLVGPLFAWAGVLLSFASLVIATREVLATETPRAFAICVIALGVPLTSLFWLVT